MVYFNNGVYDKALILFSDLMVNNPSNDTLVYYTAVCYFHQNDYLSSIEMLKGLSLKPKFAYYHESKWYYSLTLIQLGKTSSADSLLQSIIRDKSPFIEKAKQELEKL